MVFLTNCPTVQQTNCIYRVCPCEGVITFSGTTFTCNIHSHAELDDKDEEGGDGNGEVPYL